MDAREYVKTRLEQMGADSTSLGDKVYLTRSPQSDDKGGVPLPSIVWRQEGVNGAGVGIDGTSDPAVKLFEIEARSETADGANMMSETVLNYLRPRLTHIIADYDEPDDTSQEVGVYFSHILMVGVSNG